MNLKQVIDNPKIWQTITTILTAVLGYFGYVQVAGNTAPAPEVNIEVAAPTPSQHHTHKDWTDAIERADKKREEAHKDRFH